MAYETMITMKTKGGESRDIYLHAGKEVEPDIVDSFARLFREDSSRLWDIVDYVAVRCPYDERWYRIYQEDRWTFWVERSRE